MKSKKETSCAGCIVLWVFVLAILAFSAWVFMSLWNLVVPPIFHGPQLTYWQATALLALIGFIANIFKSGGSK